MTKLSKREQYLVVIVLIFALLALFIYYYYFPLQNEIKQLEEESLELSLEIDEAKNRALLMDTTKKEIENLQEQTSENRNFLMKSIDEPTILQYISDHLQEKSQIQQIRYNEVIDNESYFSKEIVLNFTASYTDLKEILKGFEEGDNFTLVPAIYISPMEEVPSSDNSQLNVTMTMVFFAEESSWNSSGQHDFLTSGSYGKNNLFK